MNVELLLFEGRFCHFGQRLAKRCQIFRANKGYTGARIARPSKSIGILDPFRLIKIALKFYFRGDTLHVIWQTILANNGESIECMTHSGLFSITFEVPANCHETMALKSLGNFKLGLGRSKNGI